MQTTQLDEVTQKTKELGLGTAVDCLKALRKHLDNPSKTFPNKWKKLLTYSIGISFYKYGYTEWESTTRSLCWAIEHGDIKWIRTIEPVSPAELKTLEEVAVVLLLADSFRHACEKFQYRREGAVTNFLLTLFYNYDLTPFRTIRWYEQSFMPHWEEALQKVESVNGK